MSNSEMKLAYLEYFIFCGSNSTQMDASKMVRKGKKLCFILILENWEHYAKTNHELHFSELNIQRFWNTARESVLFQIYFNVFNIKLY